MPGKQKRVKTATDGWKRRRLSNSRSPPNRPKTLSSGGSRNLQRGVQLRVHEAQPKIFGLPRPLPDVNART